ncbi:hypothetical protein [Chitinivibrio alkaliphilus]|uniref:Uncharacterized protein n=1 Tax=Chitinivibrio alkaliphilus ACht1 TaxID=1313304 RepID=U7D5I4_9BACT|nr:hypothetical protein [Chitinivibrio alkaliphilus]ERP31223.1 hypothetical protein CALK_1839 [Chitinivibrio alkaliphilus ACht1]
MRLAHQKTTAEIHLVSENEIELRFGCLKLYMTKVEFAELAHLLELSPDTPQTKVWALTKTHVHRLYLTYRGVTMQMCPHAFERFMHLTAEAWCEYKRLEDIQYKQSRRDIENLIQSIEENSTNQN